MKFDCCSYYYKISFRVSYSEKFSYFIYLCLFFINSLNFFRRNEKGDRDRALQTVLQVTSSNDGAAVSPDIICLAGRIYKDKFIASNYEDRESLDKAIEWYRRAFDLSPLEYSGINLITLLRARGETFENNSEMQQIGNYKL